MYKKVMILGTLSLLLLSACSEEKNDSDVREKTDEDAVAVQQATTNDDGGEQETTMKDTSGAANESTTVKSKTASEEMQETEESIQFIGTDYTKGDIKVTYPQLVDGDAATSETINRVIAEDATYLFEDGSYEGYSGEITYDISFLNKDIVSITYKGLIISPDHSYPVHLFYSTLVNLQTGDKVILSDLVAIDNAFVQAFRQGNILTSESAEYKSEVKKYTDSLSDEKLISEFSQADTHTSDVYTYLTDQSLIVTMGVIHALGDYIQVEIPKSGLNLKDIN